MNSLAWIGIIIWGVCVTGFGLATAGPAGGEGDSLPQAQDLLFLLAGGLVTCLIGLTGLLGFLGWIPGVRAGEKTCA